MRQSVAQQSSLIQSAFSTVALWKQADEIAVACDVPGRAQWAPPHRVEEAINRTGRGRLKEAPLQVFRWGWEPGDARQYVAEVPLEIDEPAEKTRCEWTARSRRVQEMALYVRGVLQ